MTDVAGVQRGNPFALSGNLTISTMCKSPEPGSWDHSNCMGCACVCHNVYRAPLRNAGTNTPAYYDLEVKE